MPSFAHTSITVRDMETSLTFYHRWFGMELDRRHEIPSNRAEIAFLKCPSTGTVLELTHWWDKAAEEWTEGDELDHLAFHVEDLATLVEEARQADVEVAKEPYNLPDSNTKLAFLLDPNGIWIELIERGN